jgi:signal peptidase I
MWLVAIQRRCRQILLAGAIAATLPAIAEPAPNWISGVYAGKSPRAIALPATAAWQRARALSTAEPRAFVVVGTGQSMQPLYPPGTLLVLRAVSFSELQAGQTAVYRNQSHHAIAHVLVAKTRDGWRVAGLNNPMHDMEPVVAGNLVGVVIAAYQPLPEAVLTLVAAR